MMGNLEEAVLPSLLQFVCMIEHGEDIVTDSTWCVFKSDLAMAQGCQGSIPPCGVVLTHPTSEPNGPGSGHAPLIHLGSISGI